MTSATAVARRETQNERVDASAIEKAKTKELAPLLEERARRLIEPLLPKGVTYERILAETFFAIQRNPKLADCTPPSLVAAVAQATKEDLEIGVLAHIVPFDKSMKINGAWQDVPTATYIRDYKGDATLVIRAGAARVIDAQVVREHDFFEYELGTNPFVKHRPAPSNRGKLVAAYAVARINRDDVKIFVMSQEEVDAHRKRFSKQWVSIWKSGKKVGDYTGQEPELAFYGPKTCVHQVCKLLPKSPKLDAVLKAFAAEEVAEFEEVEGDDPSMREVGQIEGRGPSGVNRIAARSELPIGPASSAMARESADDPYALDRSKADADGVALASPEQKRRITDLLGRTDIDIDDDARVRYASKAGPSTFTSDAADAMMAELQGLIAPLDQQEQGTIL